MAATPPMLRIGLLLDGIEAPAWIARIVRDIQTSDFARVQLVVLNAAPAVPPERRFRARIREFWQRGLYHRYRAWDRRRQPPAPDAFASVNLEPELTGVPRLDVSPERGRFVDRLSAGDLEQIADKHLDVIFRFGFRILKGGILTAARCGVWSYHHGDNREYRGSAAGFWEIYERNPVTGSILQHLTESLDAGRVLYRSWSATDPYSHHASINPMYWKSAAFALRRLRDLHERGWASLQSQAEYLEASHYSKPLYRLPSLPVMARYLGRQSGLRARDRVRALPGRPRREWFIAYRRRPAGGRPVWEDASGFQELPQPRDRFFADPFLWEQDGRTWLFFENYDYRRERACISYWGLGQEGPTGEPGTALELECHLSYPFLFEHDGEVYMIPETRQRRRIEIYRAIGFPDRWELAGVLLDDVEAVDATVLSHGGELWLFANLAEPGASVHDELHVFHAAHPLGPWQTHASNPVVSDVRRARPAGAVLNHHGMLIRPSQDCSRRYGGAIQFHRIEVLTAEQYREHPVGRLEPDWHRQAACTHTYNRAGGFEVVDGMRWRRGKPSRRPQPEAAVAATVRERGRP